MIKIKTGKCEICASNGELHIHHIVPRSLGGDDSSKNLISLCVDCHNKAHNCSFGGDSGLIKSAALKKKINLEKHKDWLEQNEVGLVELLTDFAIECDQSDYISASMKNSSMSAIDFYEILNYGKVVSRKKNFGDTSTKLFNFYKNNIDKYSIDMAVEAKEYEELNAICDSRKGQKYVLKVEVA